MRNGHPSIGPNSVSVHISIEQDCLFSTTRCAVAMYRVLYNMLLHQLSISRERKNKQNEYEENSLCSIIYSILTAFGQKTSRACKNKNTDTIIAFAPVVDRRQCSQSRRNSDNINRVLPIFLSPLSFLFVLVGEYDVMHRRYYITVCPFLCAFVN